MYLYHLFWFPSNSEFIFVFYLFVLFVLFILFCVPSCPDSINDHVELRPNKESGYIFTRLCVEFFLDPPRVSKME